MRRGTLLASLLIGFALSACNSIETRHTEADAFTAGNYSYYKWRSQPLANPTGSDDLLYSLDPLVRRAVDRELTAKGYVLDPERAQFSVDYLQAMGLRRGVASQDAGGIDPIPSARPNRQINQAMVDNANALAGIQETNNIAIQINDVASQTEVWHVIITKIVDNANEPASDKLQQNVDRGVKQGLRSLPKAR